MILGFTALSAMYIDFARQVHFGNSASALSRADAIVVLTGEQKRIHSAIKLLHEKQGKRLLISGVNRGVSKHALKHSLSVDSNAFSCCIDLDYRSVNTRQNAENASAWAEIHGFESLFVVTSDYHMPRSLLLMQRAMPRMTLIPAAVNSTSLAGNSLVETIASPLLFKEFSKYLIVQLHMEPTANYFRTAALSSVLPRL